MFLWWEKTIWRDGFGICLVELVVRQHRIRGQNYGQLGIVDEWKRLTNDADKVELSVVAISKGYSDIQLNSIIYFRSKKVIICSNVSEA